MPDDAGRRYAAVSGDVNPIHLSGLTREGVRVQAGDRARHVGRRRGRWPRCPGRLPDAVTADVAFRKPLFLPSTVTLSTAAAGDGWDLAVRSAKAAPSTWSAPSGRG